MADIFQDYIPEGEDGGALGGKGYADFVPEREPELKPVEKPTQAEKLSEEDLADMGVKEPVEEVTKPKAKK